MRKHKNLSAFDGSISGDDTIPRNSFTIHSEVAALVHDEPVQLDKAPRIKKHADPLTCRELSCTMLLGYTVYAAALLCSTQRLHSSTR